MEDLVYSLGLVGLENGPERILNIFSGHGISHIYQVGPFCKVHTYSKVK